jgi:hypothetical protein
VKAEIVVGATAQNGTVIVDGVNISKFTRGFCLESGVNEITRLQLDLVATKGATVFADAVVELAPEVEVFLVHLGWTPPNVAVESDSGDRQPRSPQDG